MNHIKIQAMPLRFQRACHKPKQIRRFPGTSPEFNRECRTAYRQLPPSIRRFFRQLPVRLWLGRSIVQIYPGNPFEKPRGYKPGSTYAHVPALYYRTANGRRIMMVGEECKNKETDKIELNEDPGGLVRHEAGHAICALTSKSTNPTFKAYTEFCKIPAFRKAYNKDIVRLKTAQAPYYKKYEYFMAKRTHGPDETFAEGAAALMGGGGIIDRLIFTFDFEHVTRLLKEEILPSLSVTPEWIKAAWQRPVRPYKTTEGLLSGTGNWKN